MTFRAIIYSFETFEFLSKRKKIVFFLQSQDYPSKLSSSLFKRTAGRSHKISIVYLVFGRNFMLKNWIWGVSFFSAIGLIACGGDSTLKWSFGGPQHVRNYTAWPNRAKGPFSQF
jgi:hypothetical protein